MSAGFDKLIQDFINSQPDLFYRIEFNFFDKPEPFKYLRKPNNEFFKDYKVIRDKEAFEDARIMAEIAYRTHNESFWFAAMQALKAAYRGK